MPNLTSMQYRDYVWPHNPSTYSISYAKDVVQHRYPHTYGSDLEDMGVEARIFRGTGAFFGEGAYDEFKRLATVFYQPGPGRLIHPTWMPVNAVFSKLEMREESVPDYVVYDFEFIEHTEINVIEQIVSKPSTSTPPKPGSSTSSPTSNAKTVTHIVRGGETLSGIGAAYGVPWRNIADANKSLIKDPNQIQIGWKLTIPNPTKSGPSTVKNTKNTKTGSSKTSGKVVGGIYTDGIGSGIAY